MFNIKYPYNEMLESLKKIEGFEGFKKRVESESVLNDYWKAEVKALYEVNLLGFLKKISSQNKSEPEGFVNLPLFNTNGIIEAAYINYLFDTNEDNKKLINKSIGKIKEEVLGKELKTKIFIEGKNEIQISYSLNGYITQGKNIDLSKKIKRIYEEKRKQHIKKYRDYFKIYYFLIDCPPARIKEINGKRILGYMHDKEMVVICSTYFFDQKLQEIKHVIFKDFGFDLPNKYFYSKKQ